ncbi:hypothetical protein AAW14_06440 [Streptomyces hygroscopicus]|nr:hypothetical protein [Streptomyces hygroscopicus]
MTARSLDEWHAVDAPFTPLTDWDPIPGRCSRCGQPAWLGESRWWHDLAPCKDRGLPAEFLPDPR